MSLRTADGLAADLQRHLVNEPVVARPPSTACEIQKAWQRNRLAFSAAATVALALVVGTSVSTWQAVRATWARGATGDRSQHGQCPAGCAASVSAPGGPKLRSGPGSYAGKDLYPTLLA